MFEKYFGKVFAFVSRFKKSVLGILCAVVVACIIAATQIRFDSDLSGMLPADPELRRDFDLVRESVFAGKVVLSFELKGNDASLDDLARYLDQVAVRLPGPLVSDVVKGPSFVPEDLARLVQFSPRLMTRERLEVFSTRMSANAVDESLSSVRSRLMSFQGMFTGHVLRVDPLGVFAGEFASLQRLAGVFGNNVTFYNGHFAAQDGRHLMLILQTPIVITDGAGASKLLAHIRACLEDRPAFVGVDIVAGHAHTLANEILMKGDIARTSIVAAVVFLIVLIAFFKDLRAAVFFLIPACSILIALVCSGMLFGKISAFVAALSSVIIGIADDYGIHVYTAIRTAGRRDVVVHIARPIVLAAVFTCGIFSVFFFSSIPGYHQLAFLTIMSIVLCVGFVLLIYPHSVTTAPLFLPGSGEEKISRRRDRMNVLVWGILLAVMCLGAARMQFSSDISTLDGIDDNIRSGERKFEQVWSGGRKQGLFVVTAPTLDEALTVNAHVFQESSAFSQDIASIAPFLVAEQEQQKNMAAWREFWKGPEGQALVKRLQVSSRKFGFAQDAFLPFLDLTRADVFPQARDVVFLKQLSKRFVSYSQNSVRVMTYFPDEPRYLEHFKKLEQKHLGTFVFSRGEFAKRFSSSVNQEAARLAGCAGLLLCVVAAVFLRKLHLILVSLSVVGTSLLAVAAAFGFWGQPLTAPAVVALMIAVGLSIDYGVFMLFSLQHKIDTGTAKAIGISALTTLVGALSLLAAQHPALFSIGVSLSAGLGAGWLCAQVVVPSLYRLSCENASEDKHA